MDKQTTTIQSSIGNLPNNTMEMEKEQPKEEEKIPFEETEEIISLISNQPEPIQTINSDQTVDGLACLKSEIADQQLKMSLQISDKGDSDRLRLLMWTGVGTKFFSGIHITNFHTKEEYSYVPETLFPTLTKSTLIGNVLQGIDNSYKILSVRTDSQFQASLSYVDISKPDRPYHLGSQQFELNEACCDLAYNHRRQFAATLPKRGEISYHLFAIDDTSCKVIRATKWNSQKVDSYTGSISLDSNGDHIVIGTHDGHIVVSDVNTGKAIFEEYFPPKQMDPIRCRWSQISDDPKIVIKYNWNHVNIFDTEKRHFISKKDWIAPWEVGPQRQTKSLSWMEIQPNSPDLAAICGEWETTYLLDKRESQLIPLVTASNMDGYASIKWNPDGKSLAVSTRTGEIRIIDFVTRKVVTTLISNPSHRSSDYYHLLFASSCLINLSWC